MQKQMNFHKRVFFASKISDFESLLERYRISTPSLTGFSSRRYSRVLFALRHAKSRPIENTIYALRSSIGINENSDRRTEGIYCILNQFRQANLEGRKLARTRFHNFSSRKLPSFAHADSWVKSAWAKEGSFRYEKLWNPNKFIKNLLWKSLNAYRISLT